VRYSQGSTSHWARQATPHVCSSGWALRSRPLRAFGAAVVTVGFLFAMAGCRAATTTQTTEVEPIEECQQYERTLDTCFHRKTSFSSQPSMVALARADRDRARAMCAQSLQGLRDSCR
jgi:hypothetical protein